MTHSDRGQKQRCGVSGSEARPAVCPPHGPGSPAVQAQANLNTRIPVGAPPPPRQAAGLHTPLQPRPRPAPCHHRPPWGLVTLSWTAYTGMVSPCSGPEGPVPAAQPTLPVSGEARALRSSLGTFQDSTSRGTDWTPYGTLQGCPRCSDSGCSHPSSLLRCRSRPTC